MAWGEQHQVADSNIRLRGGGQFDMFPSISRCFFIAGMPKSIAKLDGAMIGFSLPFLSTTAMVNNKIWQASGKKITYACPVVCVYLCCLCRLVDE